MQNIICVFFIDFFRPLFVILYGCVDEPMGGAVNIVNGNIVIGNIIFILTLWWGHRKR